MSSKPLPPTTDLWNPIHGLAQSSVALRCVSVLVIEAFPHRRPLMLLGLIGVALQPKPRCWFPALPPTKKTLCLRLHQPWPFVLRRADTEMLAQKTPNYSCSLEPRVVNSSQRRIGSAVLSSSARRRIGSAVLSIVLHVFRRFSALRGIQARGCESCQSCRRREH